MSKVAIAEMADTIGIQTRSDTWNNYLTGNTHRERDDIDSTVLEPADDALVEAVPSANIDGTRIVFAAANIATEVSA